MSTSKNKNKDPEDHKKSEDPKELPEPEELPKPEKSQVSLKTNSNLLVQYNLGTVSNYGAKTNVPATIIKTVEISQDNKLVYASGYDCKHIIVLKIEEPKFVEYLIKHTDCVFCVKINPKKDLLMSGGRDHRVVFWRVIKKKNGEVKDHKVLKEITTYQHFVMSVRFSGDGEKAFALFQDNNIYQFDTDEFNVVRTYTGFHNFFNDKYFDVSDNGSRIFGFANTNNNSFKSIRYKQETPRYKMGGKESPLTTCNFVKKFDFIIYGDNLQKIFFLDIRIWKNRRIYKQNIIGAAQNSTINVSPNQDVIYVGGHNRQTSFLVFKITDNRRVFHWKSITDITHLVEASALSQCGRFLAIGGDANVTIMDSELPFSVCLKES